MGFTPPTKFHCSDEILLSCRWNSSGSSVGTQDIRGPGLSEPNYISNVLTVSAPLFNDQWYIADTNFDKAWEKTESKDPIKIAVIDSGVDAGHPDLNGKILNGCDFVNDDSAADDINPGNNSRIIKYQIKWTRGSSGHKR